ncbi:hypothetical protein GCAAIG_02490 [Candidatus Electronema halotolerans]
MIEPPCCLWFRSGPPDGTLGRIAVFFKDIAGFFEHRFQLLYGEVVAVPIPFFIFFNKLNL